jgi:hypothetical protein
VGCKAKFWILRLLGWWHYDAGRPLAPMQEVQKGGIQNAPTITRAADQLKGSTATAGTPLSESQADGERADAAPLPVFPLSVRPLVLRGHALRVKSEPGASLQPLLSQLALWSLLALALGRRPVMPLLPCVIPPPEVPAQLRDTVLLVKIAERSLCDAPTRLSSWRMAASTQPEHSHEALRVTKEMSALGDYKGVMDWPPRRAAGCCQVLPELKCIDQYGDGGELAEELMLSESDLGWLGFEERALTSTQRTSDTINATALSPGHGQSLTLDMLRRQSHVRTLVIDLKGRGGSGDPFAQLPGVSDVEMAIKLKLRSRASGLRGWRARKCVERLLRMVTSRSTLHPKSATR